MTICHVNDEFFWLVADRAGLPPLRALATIGLGTLLQGLIAAVALCLSGVALLPRLNGTGSRRRLISGT